MACGTPYNSSDIHSAIQASSVATATITSASSTVEAEPRYPDIANENRKGMVRVAAPYGGERDPGVVDYNVMLTNLGDSTETYNVTVQNSTTWPLDRSNLPSQLVLGPRAKASYNVSLTVPTGLAATSEHQLTISAQNVDGTTGDSATISTFVKCSLSFSDVATDSPDYPGAIYAACRGLLNGTEAEDGSLSFRPDAAVTEAEFFTLLSFLAQGRTVSTLLGDRDAIVSRAEAAQRLVQAMAYTPYDPFQPSFSDVPNNHQSYIPVETIVAKHIVKPVRCPSGEGFCFRPDAPITRAELSQWLRSVLS